MASNDAFDAWVHATFGVNPGSFASGGAASPDPWAGAASPAPAPKPAAQPAESDHYPRPMQGDCVIVRGKVPGPANHVLCGKHGHVLDIKTKTIIARDVKDYQARKLAEHVVQGAAPVVQGAVDGLKAMASAMAPLVPGGGHAAATPGAPPAPAAASAAAAPPAQDDRNRAYDAATMQVIANQIVEYLHAQYVDLSDTVEEVTNEWSIKIDKLKEEAPKEPGGLLSRLGSALLTVSAIVFPELAVVKVALTVKDVSEKVDKAKEGDEQAAEAAKAKAVFASKMQAKEALSAFAKEVRSEARNARAALVKRVREAVAGFQPPPDFYDTIAKDFDKYVHSFAVDRLGIKIGTDQDPAAMQKVRTTLGSAIGKWMQQQYVQEHEQEKVLKGPAGMFVGYGAFTPEILKQKVDAYLKDNPDEKERIEKELREEYTDEFIKKVFGET
jgi:hypothetical protein